VRTPQGWQATSWSSYAQQVQSAARSLLALGVKPGNAVCILGFNRPEWTTLNMATLMIGGVAVGIYWSSAANEVAYIVEHSGCRVLLLENAAQWRKVANHPDVLARLSAVVLMDAQDTPAADGSGNGLPAPLMPWGGLPGAGFIQPGGTAPTTHGATGRRCGMHPDLHLRYHRSPQGSQAHAREPQLDIGGAVGRLWRGA
jgi:long-chain acyl-CoA synthetase